MSGSQFDVSHHIPNQTKTRLISSALSPSVWVRVTAYLSCLKGPAAEGLPAVPPVPRLVLPAPLSPQAAANWLPRSSRPLEGLHVPWITKHRYVLSPPWPSSCWSPPQHDVRLSVAVVLSLGLPGRGNDDDSCHREKRG